MKKPAKPPSEFELMEKATAAQLTKALDAVSDPTVNGKYVHWDKLRFLTPPDGLTTEDWWIGLKFRRSNRKVIPLK